jgi:hypothetical protein
MASAVFKHSALNEGTALLCSMDRANSFAPCPSIEWAGDHFQATRRTVASHCKSSLLRNPDLYIDIKVNILVRLALHWALISECLTCLKPFLQTCHENVPANSSALQYGGALSNMLSDSGTKRQSGDDRSHPRASRLSKYKNIEDEGVDGALRLCADKLGFSAKVVFKKKKNAGAGRWGRRQY